jgi:hypothetical protein
MGIVFGLARLDGVDVEGVGVKLPFEERSS